MSRTIDRRPTDLRRAMAYSRATFKDRVEEKIGGALLEFYKAELVILHGQTQWVKHWQSEVDQLLRGLQVVLLHTAKFKDKRKAVAEVFADVQGLAANYRRAAGNIICKDYGLKKLTHPLPAATTGAFFARVQEVVDQMLPA